MIKREKFKEITDNYCRRCGMTFEKGYSNGFIIYCEDCYEFIFDLLEAGEKLSMYEIMGEG